MVENLQNVVSAARTRLAEERKTVVTQQLELGRRLQEVELLLAGIAAFEATVKRGAAQPAPPAKTSRPAVRQRTEGGGRRTGQGDNVLRVVRESGSGLTRAEIMDRMKVKGDQKAEMSVANALTSLSKSNRLIRHDHKYVVRPAEAPSASPSPRAEAVETTIDYTPPAAPYQT
jgi:hypothetical protein